MGRWDRRWIPRRSYKSKKYPDYDYEEPPPSPPSPHHLQSNPPAIQDNSGSSWEMEFCKSVRVPWKKVVTAKKYMYCHDNIVKWDDSAAEEAFRSAKQRYWEKINCFTSETPLPDPHEYIDEIDWNTDIDPGLISELDRAYFNPDEVGNWRQLDKMEINLIPVCDFVQSCENPEIGQNPWESSPTREVGRVKEASKTWGHHTKSINAKDDNNPWEQNYITVNETSKNNVWKGCANESWESKQKQKNNCRSSDFNNNSLNSGNGGCQNMGHVGGKLRTYVDDRSSSRQKWHSCSYEQQHPVYAGNSWQSSSASRPGESWDREGRESVSKTWDSNRSRVHHKMPHNSDFQEACGGNNALQSACRKREGSFQHPPRYKSSRFQGSNYGVVHQWQKGKYHERVNFGC